MSNRLISQLTLSNEDDTSNDTDGNTAVREAKPRLRKPSMYQVVLLNDDYTPMEFVIDVLERFFYMDREKATRVMLMVHTQGKGVCGVFSKDVAETKAEQVNVYSRESEHPLLCEIEPSDDEDE